jgi:hypothetical protein
MDTVVVVEVGMMMIVTDMEVAMIKVDMVVAMAVVVVVVAAMVVDMEVRMTVQLSYKFLCLIHGGLVDKKQCLCLHVT